MHDTAFAETRPAPDGEAFLAFTQHALNLAKLAERFETAARTMMVASMTIATYTMNYLNVFANHTLGMPPAQAFGAALGSRTEAGAIGQPQVGQRVPAAS